MQLASRQLEAGGHPLQLADEGRQVAASYLDRRVRKGRVDLGAELAAAVGGDGHRLVNRVHLEAQDLEGGRWRGTLGHLVHKSQIREDPHHRVELLEAFRVGEVGCMPHGEIVHVGQDALEIGVVRRAPRTVAKALAVENLLELDGPALLDGRALGAAEAEEAVAEVLALGVTVAHEVRVRLLVRPVEEGVRQVEGGELVPRPHVRHRVGQHVVLADEGDALRVDAR